MKTNYYEVVLKPTLQRYQKLLVATFFAFLFEGAFAEGQANTIRLFDSTWAIEQLPTAPTTRPAASREIATLLITKNSNGTWRLGRSLSDESAEMIYVDRVNKKIGPYASSLSSQGEDYSCDESRAKTKSKLARKSLYSACRSDFYSADKFVEVGQAFLACALLGCLGGYSEDWYPIFRPNKFKMIFDSPNVSTDIKATFTKLDRQPLETAIRTFRKKMYAINSDAKAELKKSEISTKISQSKTSVQKLEQLALDLISAWAALESKFDNHRYYPFGMTVLEKNLLRKKIESQYFSDLNDLEVVATKTAEHLQKLEIRERAIVRGLQSLLGEHEYYTATIDGTYGPGTDLAIRNFFADVNQPLHSKNRQQTIQAIKSSILEKGKKCSYMKSINSQTVCFTLKK